MKNQSAARIKLLQDVRVQQFLSKFIMGDIGILKPVFDTQYGYTYPLVEEVIGEPFQADKFLNELSEADILKRELHEQVIQCPNCKSSNVSIRYRCPSCGSFNIQKSSLIEHLSCGYMDIEERFKKEHELECPRCGKKLGKPNVDYKKAGVWCTCAQCNKKFDIPVPSHHCRNCQRDFSFEDALYKDVYSYRLSEDAMKEALSSNLVVTTAELLESYGFKVESPGLLQGKSGMPHTFDIIAQSRNADQNIIAIDLATSTDNIVPEQHIAAIFAKTYDVASCEPLLIAVPKLDENGKRLAKVYNIKVIEATSQEETRTALKALITTKTQAFQG